MLETNLKKVINKFGMDSLLVEPTDSYYDHITFSIQSLSDFIKLIEVFSNVSKDLADLRWLYRGISNSSWHLMPSIQKKLNESKISYSLEHDLAVEFRSEVPDMFSNTESNFEKIAKMQHFGIPTRLLDFSLNPLIALYFACEKHPRTPGRVVFTLNKLHHYDEKCVESISSLYLYDDCTNIKLDDFLKPYDITVSDYLFKIYTDIHMSAPMFVKPPYLDKRMQAQKSVFLLFANYLRDSLADRSYYNYGNVELEKLKYEDIDYVYKEQIDSPRMILHESPYFIVDKDSFERLAESYRNVDNIDFIKEINNAFENRFLMQNYIMPLDMYDIWYNFASIVISPKYKKLILEQLEYIGIDEAYVYPEAEHIAKRIEKQKR